MLIYTIFLFSALFYMILFYMLWIKSKPGEFEFNDTIKNNYLNSLKSSSGCRIELEDLIYKIEIIE